MHENQAGSAFDDAVSGDLQLHILSKDLSEGAADLPVSMQDGSVMNQYGLGFIEGDDICQAPVIEGGLEALMNLLQRGGECSLCHSSAILSQVTLIRVRIRQADRDDISAVIALYTAAGIEEESFTPDEAREHFAHFARYPSYRLFVAEAEDLVVGAYSLLILDNLAKRGRRSGVVEDVAVLPAYQGQGVGRAMMRHAMEECRIAGCYKLALSSNLKREAAHCFYESLGFARHGYSFLIEFPPTA